MIQINKYKVYLVKLWKAGKFWTRSKWTKPGIWVLYWTAWKSSCYLLWISNINKSQESTVAVGQRESTYSWNCKIKIPGTGWNRTATTFSAHSRPCIFWLFHIILFRSWLFSWGVQTSMISTKSKTVFANSSSQKMNTGTIGMCHCLKDCFRPLNRTAFTL